MANAFDLPYEAPRGGITPSLHIGKARNRRDPFQLDPNAGIDEQDTQDFMEKDRRKRMSERGIQFRPDITGKAYPIQSPANVERGVRGMDIDPRTGRAPQPTAYDKQVFAMPAQRATEESLADKQMREKATNARTLAKYYDDELKRFDEANGFKFKEQEDGTEIDLGPSATSFAGLEQARKKAGETTGFIRGALTSAVAGQPTPDAQAAQGEVKAMEEAERVYKLKLEKRNRLKALRQSAQGTLGEVEGQLAQRAAGELGVPFGVADMPQNPATLAPKPAPQRAEPLGGGYQAMGDGSPLPGKLAPGMRRTVEGITGGIARVEDTPIEGQPQSANPQELERRKQLGWEQQDLTSKIAAYDMDFPRIGDEALKTKNRADREAAFSRLKQVRMQLGQMAAGVQGTPSVPPESLSPFSGVPNLAPLAVADAIAPNLTRSVMRGATSEGAGAAIEGGIRAFGQYGDTLRKTGMMGIPGLLINAFTSDEQKALARKGATVAADAVQGVRQDLREAMPVSEAFAQSKVGQIAQGVGQAIGTLPAWAVPGMGPITSVAQIYQEGYDDAIQSGATPEQAQAAATKYLPASALDIVGDKLVVGRFLKPFIGQPISAVLRELATRALGEGVTEAAQQAWLNMVAKTVEGYDPNRPFTQDLWDSFVVGTAVGVAAQVPTTAQGISRAGRGGQPPPIPQPGQTPPPIPPAESVPADDNLDPDVDPALAAELLGQQSSATSAPTAPQSPPASPPQAGTPVATEPETLEAAPPPQVGAGVGQQPGWKPLPPETPPVATREQLAADEPLRTEIAASEPAPTSATPPDLVSQAAEILRADPNASASKIQRKLKIGYNAAQRLLDTAKASLANNVPYRERVKSAAADRLVDVGGKKWFVSSSDRPTVLMRVGNAVIPFYRSVSGTGGKKQRGKWYAYGGHGYEGWYIKGTNEDIMDSYGSQEIRDAEKYLNDNFNWPRELDDDLSLNRALSPLSALGEPGDTGDINSAVFNSRDEQQSFSPSYGDPAGHIRSLLSRAKPAPARVAIDDPDAIEAAAAAQASAAAPTDYDAQTARLDEEVRQRRAKEDAEMSALPVAEQDPDFWVRKEIERQARERGWTLQEARTDLRAGLQKMILNGIRRQVAKKLPFHKNAIGERYLDKVPRGYALQGDRYVYAAKNQPLSPEPAARVEPASDATPTPVGPEGGAAPAGPKFSKSSTQVTLPAEKAKPFVDFANTIAEEDVYTDPNDSSYGRETEPHVTALYGIENDDVEPVRAALAGIGPITVKVGKASSFENEDRPYDVLKFDINSPQLHRVNALIKKGTKNSSDFPDYKPHLTIAYVKKGAAKKYVGNAPLTGSTFTFDSLQFRTRDGRSIDIPLTGKSSQPPVAASDQPRAIVPTPEPGPAAALSAGTETAAIAQPSPQQPTTASAETPPSPTATNAAGASNTPAPQPISQPPPAIARGATTAASLMKAATGAAKVKPASKQGKFLAEFSNRLSRANAKALADMEVHVRTQAQWDADEALKRGAPDSSAAYDQETNTLYLNSDKLTGDNIASAIVHEAGHFAEKFALGEEFTQRQWEALTHEQRVAASNEYSKRKDTAANTDERALRTDKRARAEWVAMQFARVVRGDTKGMQPGVAAKLKAWLDTVRSLVSKWVGSGNLTTKELDAKILEMMGYAESAPEPTPPAPAKPKADPRDKIFARILSAGKPVGPNLYEFAWDQITPALRAKLDADPSPELRRPRRTTENFALLDKGDVTGNQGDRGYILKDMRGSKSTAEAAPAKPKPAINFPTPDKNSRIARESTLNQDALREPKAEAAPVAVAAKIEAPAPVAPGSWIPADFKRKTPAKGTPQRQTLEDTVSELRANFNRLTNEYQLAQKAEQRARYGSANWSKRRIESDTARRKMEAARVSAQDFIKRYQDAIAEDVIEEGNPIRSLKAQEEVLGDRGAYKRAEKLFVDEAVRQGATQTDAKRMFMDDWSLGSHSIKTLEEAVRVRVQTAANKVREDSISKEVGALEDLDSITRSSFSIRLKDAVAEPEKFAETLAEAKAANAEKAKINRAERAKQEKAASEAIQKRADNTAKVQGAISVASRPIAKKPSFSAVQSEMLRQVDAALEVAPVVLPQGFKEQQKRLKELAELGLTEEQAKARAVEPDAAPLAVTFRAGNSILKVFGDYYTLAELKRRIERPMRKKPDVPTGPIQDRAQSEVKKDYKKIAPDTESVTARFLIDQMTDATLAELGLDKQFKRYKGAVYPFATAVALESGKLSGEMLGTPAVADSPRDLAESTAQAYIDVAMGRGVWPRNGVKISDDEANQLQAALEREVFAWPNEVIRRKAMVLQKTGVGAENWDRNGVGILGAPAEKPEPVEGEPGKFYRSTPDSINEALGEKAQAVMRQIYERRGQADDAVIAADMRKELGDDDALRVATDSTDVPASVRTIMWGQLLSDNLAKSIDTKLSEADRRKAMEAAESMTQKMAPKLTEAGQGISALQQVYKDVRAATMATIVEQEKARVEQKLGKDATNAVEQASEELRRARASTLDRLPALIMERIRGTKVTRSIWDQYVSAATKRLVDTIGGKGATARRLKAPMQEVADLITKQLQSKFGELFPDAAKPTPESAADVLKRVIENRSNNRAKYNELVEAVRAGIQEKFGDNPDLAEELDTILDGFVDRPYAENTLKRAMREALKDAGTSIAQQARRARSDAGRFGEALADELVKRMGLSQEDAAKLAGDIKRKFMEALDAKRQANLNQLRGRLTLRHKSAPQALSIVERAIEAKELGLLDDISDDAMKKYVAGKLGLATLTPEQSQKIITLANDVQNATPGTPERARAEIELANRLHIMRGTGPSDFLTSLWYANVLSGPMTHASNAMGNSLQGTLELLTAMAVRPGRAGQAIAGWLGGWKQGFESAANIVRTGHGGREFDAKTGHAGETLELVSKYGRDIGGVFDSPMGTAAKGVATVARYVPRFLRAADSLFYYPAREAYTRMMATKLLESEYKGAELHKKVRETLGLAPDIYRRFEQQAQREGWTDRFEKGQRIAQLIEEHRRASKVGAELEDAGERFGLQSTFNQNPEGIAGLLAKHLSNMTESVKVGGVPVLKPFLPFLRVPANLFNASMNYTPVGALRAARGVGEVVEKQGKWTTELRKLSPEERDRRYVQAFLGSAMMGAIAAAALNDDDDKWFDITAEGPEDFKQRNQLRATGWIDHSIKVGDRYIRYMDSPLFVPLTGVGSVVDSLRYGKGKDEGMTLKAMRVAQRSVASVFQTSMFSGVAEMTDLINSRSGPEAFVDFLTRAASGVAVPNLVGQVDKMLDPTVRDKNTDLGRPGANVPFVRRTGSERTDLLGNPIESGPMKRFTSEATNDPLWETIARKQAWISTPSKETKIGNRTMTADEYRDFIRISGQGIERRLRPILPVIQKLDDERAQKLVDRIVREEREKAKLSLRRPAA